VSDLDRFDFVTDDGLRASLASDASELSKCIEASAYKAAIVLAGSIVEALISDHLISVGYKDAKGRDILTLSLSDLVAAAKTANFLSVKAADLSSAVRGYRNMIHPGRLIRESETIDAESAAIAVNVVTIVANELAGQKRSSYGYTAQELLRKVENDSSSVAILGDLLKQTREREIERLVMGVLPSRYVALALEQDNDPEPGGWYKPRLGRLQAAYRAAFNAANDEVRRRAATAYATMLREEVTEFDIITRERDLFRADDLVYMSPEDAAMAKRHLLGQLGRTYSEEFYGALGGLGSHLDAAEISEVIDTFIRYVSSRDTPARRKHGASLLDRLFIEIPTASDDVMRKRLEAWSRTLAGRDGGLADWVQEQRDALDLPF
jgi:hypothetical protein